MRAEEIIADALRRAACDIEDVGVKTILATSDVASSLSTILARSPNSRNTARSVLRKLLRPDQAGLAAQLVPHAGKAGRPRQPASKKPQPAEQPRPASPKQSPLQIVSDPVLAALVQILGEAGPGIHSDGVVLEPARWTLERMERVRAHALEHEAFGETLLEKAAKLAQVRELARKIGVDDCFGEAVLKPLY